jgi:hypothetical protein
MAQNLQPAMTALQPLKALVLLQPAVWLWKQTMAMTPAQPLQLVAAFAQPVAKRHQSAHRQMNQGMRQGLQMTMVTGSKACSNSCRTQRRRLQPWLVQPS